MRFAVGVCCLVACGGTTPPQQSPVVANRPWSAAPPTCEEVGIILRGANEDRSEAAGPAKERAIAEACTRDNWSQLVIACVAGTTDAHACLVQLTQAQHAALDNRLAAWAAQFGGDAGDSAPAATCFDALHAIELFDPPINDTSPERQWQINVRQRVLVDMCTNDPWTDEVNACLRDAASEAATGACVATLDPKVHAKLVSLRELAKAIEALRKTPAKIDCKKVAEHHHSDARTKDALKALKPAERKQLLASARKTMADACTNEGWDEPTRACMIADGGEETCFGTVRWGSVTPGIPMIAIPECGDYATAVRDLQVCSAAPADTRAAMKQAFEEVERASMNVPADQKGALATACKTAADAVVQVRAAYGC
ncbi:MAG TPA: hypothetical protein VMZ53_28475 [Kofleriaceae bacterium]|nr:hypothetical protein [Kofleriaceae bacterium]